MKKLLFLAAIFISSLLQGQNHEWSIMYYNFDIGMPYHYANTVKCFNGDTITYAGVEYVELLDQEGDIRGIYREDGLKTYYRRKVKSGYKDEFLLYDYSVLPGDTVLVSEGYESAMVIDVTETILLNGESRKMVQLSALGGNYDVIEEIWIEGIGSSFGFGISGGWSLSGGSVRLLCYHDNGELLWMDTKYNTCEYYLSIDEFEDTKVSVYPNPGENVLNIQTSLQNARVEVYDVLGKVVYKQEIINSTTISTDKWAKGMYFWRVFSNEQEVENGKWIKN